MFMILSPKPEVVAAHSAAKAAHIAAEAAKHHDKSVEVKHA
jgi:hypothetical protein